MVKTIVSQRLWTVSQSLCSTLEPTTLSQSPCSTMDMTTPSSSLWTLPTRCPWLVYIFGVFFPTSFNDCVTSPRRICATSLTMAHSAKTSLEHATLEHHGIDEFGRDIHQREWTDKYVYIEEKDKDSIVTPDGVFSISDVDDTVNVKDLEFASGCEDSIADHGNSVTGNFGRCGTCRRPRRFGRDC